jgi:mannose-P-dolichol utilization defect protein 1
VIIMLISLLSRKVGLGVVLIAMLAGVGYALFAPGVLTAPQLAIAQMATIPITSISRLPQIYTNFANGHTGQLSFISIALFFFGSLARVFTTLKEVADPILLTGFVLASILNGILFFQILFYWKVTKEKVGKRAAAPVAEDAKAAETVSGESKSPNKKRLKKE